MDHSAGKEAFHIFLWSYIIICFFILMNMLLAIIVNSYAHVKGQTEGKCGLISDLANVSWHGLRRWIGATTSRSHFVSDQKFLQARETSIPITFI